MYCCTVRACAFLPSDEQEGMMNFVQEAMGDADAILFVTDLFETEFANTQVGGFAA